VLSECIVLSCVLSTELRGSQRTVSYSCAAWRMQTLKIRTLWEVALCPRVTVPVVWQVSSSPVTALDTFKTSGTTHLGHSATNQRTWIMRNTSENHKSPWYLLIQSQIVPDFTKPRSSLPCSQQSARFSSPDSDYSRPKLSILFNVLTILLSTFMSSKFSVFSGFPTKYYTYFPSLPYLTVPVMKLLILHFSPVPR
jgi:hypothetical protein